MTTYLAVLNGEYNVKLIQTGMSAGPLPGYVLSSTVGRVESITQAEYNALSPAERAGNLYFIHP